METDYSVIVKIQNEYFNSNETKEVLFRIIQLKKLQKILRQNEKALCSAIYLDFKKSYFETYITELALVHHEINLAIRKLKKWAKPKKVGTNLANFPGNSIIKPEPFGVTLIIGAWNYPFQLTLVPAVASIAAGNTVVLKPSELTFNSSEILKEIINSNFHENFFTVVEGGVEETSKLLEQKFDKIFFTGSVPVGKIVYQAAAKNLTPVTLELGGKSPAIVLPDCNLGVTAKRLVWAKFLNAGQTCIAPDYVLVHQSVVKQFLQEIKKQIEHQFSNITVESDNYVQIINEKHFKRLETLIDRNKIFIGGRCSPENRFIEPTVLQNVSFDDAVMHDEIFGPILPVISFDNIDEIIKIIKSRPKPLSLYVFAGNRQIKNKIANEISFGGGCINDAVMHISNHSLPFGGIGASGIGSYHGKAGFQTFSHYKSIFEKPWLLEFPIKFAPYSKLKLKLIKWFMG